MCESRSVLHDTARLQTLHGVAAIVILHKHRHELLIIQSSDTQYVKHGTSLLLSVPTCMAM